MVKENFKIRQVLNCLSLLCCLSFQSISMLAQEIGTLMFQAEELEYAGLFEEALEMRSKIKILCEQEKDWENAAINHCNIGYSCWELKEHALMKIHLDSALLIAQNKKLDEFGNAYATIWNYLGYYFDERGDYKRAIDNYRKVILIDEKLASLDNNFEIENLGWDYYNLGLLHGKTGDYTNAFYYYDEAIKYFDNNHCEIAHIYNAKALHYQKSDNYTLAKKNYFLALNSLVQCSDFTEVDKANIYNNLSTLFNLNGEFDNAYYYSREVTSLDYNNDKIYSNHLFISGNTELELGNYIFAEKLFLKAIKIRKELFSSKHPSTANAYKRTAEKLYANRNQHQTALAYYQQALEQLVIDFDYCGENYQNLPIKNVQINDRLILLEVLALKAKSLEAIDNQSLAQSTLQLAIELIDDIRLNYLADGSKYILLEKAMPIYEQAVTLGLKMKEVAWAFEVAERSKATLLLESINNSEAQIFAGIDTSLLQKEQEQKVEIAFYERLLNEAHSEEDKRNYQQILFDLRQDYHQFLAELEADHPNYYQLKYDLQYPSALDIQQQVLEEGSALLEYFVGNESIYLFTLTKADIAVQQIPKNEDFEFQLQAFRNALSAPKTTPNDFAQYGQQAFSIYNNYLKTALAGLPKNTTKLLFIPDGALNYIPFQALLQHPIAAQKIEQARFDTLSYLTKQYAISYAYSSTLLLSMKQQKRTGHLKFGGFAPIFSNGKVVALRNNQLNELPHSQTELEQINQLLQGETYFKQNASLQNFKAQASNFNVLHLSTHAALDDQNPSQSRIHLYDDYITVNEIYNLPINADLTVLSACETGVGEFKRGEGLLSLARAFMYAGCPSLVTSLWQVNDQKTASLMIEFYRQLNNGLSKDEALQSAQLNYLSKLSSAQAAHPFYWAAFVQTGNSDALIQSRFSWYWLSILPIFILMGIMLSRKFG